MGNTFTISGSTRRTSDFLAKMEKPNSTLYSDLASLAQQGVNALEAATPEDTGLTANSWSYEITIQGNNLTMAWLNSHKVDDTNVAVLLQYGHATGTGGYVAGRDYINGSLKPIFDQIADSVWKKVQSA